MVFVVLVVCLLIGVPVAFAIVAALAWFMLSGDPPYHLRIVATEMFRALNSYPLLAIPLFVLAGELMNESGITHRIIAFANVLVGRFRAGLAHVNIWASVIFAGLSGSAVADTSALGRVFIPGMEKHGYDRAFAAALTAASSVIGPIIPPSIPVIIYALVVGGVSVPALFLAGVVPGLLLALFLSLYVTLAVKPESVTGTGGEEDGDGARQALLGGILPLLMPVLVVGSILLGVVTPTEAASFAVGYALLLGLLVYRNLKPAALPRIFTRAMCDSAVILIVIAAVGAANWLLTYNRIPNILTDWVVGNVDSQTAFLLAVMVLFLFVGLFLEGIAAMLVLVPILHPIAVSLAIDPVHFGIILMLNLGIGLVTPPVGSVLFVGSAVGKLPIGAMIRSIWPFYLTLILALLLITYIPWLSLWLPGAM